MTARKPRPIKHLLRKAATEPPGHITRYRAACGATGTARRDFAPDTTRNGKQVVTCLLCLDTITKRKARLK